jgi:hypothetical protein
MKPSATMFIVNLLAVIGYFVFNYRHGVENTNATMFALGSLFWGVALMLQEGTSNSRIRRLEFENEQLIEYIARLELRKNRK